MVARIYMQCCYGTLVSGQARQPRPRCLPPPPTLAHAASVGNLSVASCEWHSPGKSEEVLSICRKARVPGLHTIEGMLGFILHWPRVAKLDSSE